MTVYLDIILIENLLMNYLILFISGHILKLNLKQWRLFVSSLIGGIYAIFSYISTLPIYSSIISKILLSIIMIYIAFNPEGFKKMIRQLIVFYFISFVLGGCAFGLLYFINPEKIFWKNGVFVGSYPIKITLFAGFIGFLLIKFAFKIVKTRISKKDLYCNIKIYINGKFVNAKAIIDTGNFLKDPISKAPVIVIEKKALDKILPQQILNNTEEIIGGDEKGYLQGNYEYSKRFRIIPFSSLGKQNGMLLGIKSDKVEITLDETKKIIDDVIIGIYDKSLTKNGIYSALVGVDILEGGKEDELATDVKVQY